MSYVNIQYLILSLDRREEKCRKIDVLLIGLADELLRKKPTHISLSLSLSVSFDFDLMIHKFMFLSFL
jgi:hypothetical protein